MRILLDYRPALRQRTGVGQYVHEMARALQPQLAPGDVLTLFSSSWTDRQASGIPGAQAVDLRIPVRVLNYAWHRLEWPPVEWLAGRIDVAQSAHPLLLPAHAAARAVVIYDLDFLDHPERTRAEIRRDYPSRAGPHARRADLVVVISSHTARQVTTRLGVPAERIVLCTPGAPLWPVRDRPREIGHILFVGTIEPRKNLPRLFAAYERLLERRPQAPPLVLAGGTVESSAAILADLAARPVLAGRVRHLGYVGEEQRRRLFDEASMLVLPSLEEGFGMTALEAMQAGVPVVASRRGALPEVVGDAGELVDPEDETGMATAIERLLEDDGLRTARMEAGRTRAQQFSWQASAHRLLEAYREVLARRRTSG